MGADIYIYDDDYLSFRKRADELCEQEGGWKKFFSNEKMQAERESLNETRYFRDSYNASSLLWRYGMSWWQLSDQYCDDEGMMGKEGIMAIRQGTSYPVDEEQIRTDFADHEEGPDSWVEYFKERREKLHAFLQLALEKDAMLYCSV